MWIKVEILLVLCLASSSVLAWNWSDGGYNKINSFLVDSTETTDTQTNIIIASKMLKSEMQKGSSANKILLNDLKQFLSLIELFGPEKCTKLGYLALVSNDKATGNLAKKPTAPYRRVESIVYNSAIKHAKDCKDVYEITLKEKYESIDKVEVSRVHLYTDEVIMIDHMESRNHLSAINSFDLWERFIADESISIEGFGQTAYDSIYFLAKGDPDRVFLNFVLDEKKGARFIRKDKIAELFIRYLVKPCQYYVNELGEDLFLPAIYDGLLHKKKSDVDDKKRPLYWSWARYKICRTLIEPDHTKDLIKEVIRHAATLKSR